MSESGSHSEGKGNRGGGRRSPRSPNSDEKDLDTRTLNIQSKRFYVDIKENWRGRYMKIAESMMGGQQGGQYQRRKARIIMSLPAAEKYVQMLQKCEELGTKSDAGDEKSASTEAVLYNEEFEDSDRQFTCEYKENSRGRFLRVIMSTDSMTFGGARAVRPIINIPATGLKDMREELEPLVEKWIKDLPPDTSYKGPMPEAKSMRVGRKTFYFDYGQNKRGIFMRLSEVKPQWRTAITVPQSEWAAFAKLFQQSASICEDALPPKKAEAENGK